MIAIQKLIAQVLNIPEQRVIDDMTIEMTPEWDSLKHMELIVAIEQTYAIELSGDEIANMVSVTAIRTALEHHKK